MMTLIPLVVLTPLIGAALALLAGKRPRLQTIVSISSLVVVLVIAAVILAVVNRDGDYAVTVGGWPAPFGIVLIVDRLSALLLVVSAAVLLSVLLFSVGQGLADGDRDAPVSIYYPTYLILATGVFNAFVTGDLFNLYVSFEIVLAASYVLITLGGTAQRTRAGVTYIVVNLVSSFIFLAAIAMLYGATGTVNIAQLSLRIVDLPLDVEILLHVMLLVAFGIKAAVFPLAFWLPDSYPTAPAPVTAVFAGLLTKIGIYAIMRTEMTIFPGPALNTPIMIAAALTLVVGILGAIAQSDIKRLLSFVLISHIGYMLFGIGLGTPIGLAAATFFVVHHIIVQTTLFLATGLVERRGGTTAINRLGGMVKTSPVIGILFFIPMVNLGGIPPFSGFIGKLALFDASVKDGTPLAYGLIAAAALVSLLTLYVLARTWNLVFWRPAGQVHDEEILPERPWQDSSGAHTQVQERRQIPRTMLGATGGMVALSVALSVFAGPLYDISSRAGVNIARPDFYISTVLPGAQP